MSLCNTASLGDIAPCMLHHSIRSIKQVIRNADVDLIEFDMTLVNSEF